MMKLIENTEFGGERPLFASRDIKLENVIIQPVKQRSPGLSQARGLHRDLY